MKSIVLITLALLMTLALTSATQTSAKLRRDGVLNLYPFPRVGRSYWRVPLEDELDHNPSKKSSLYAFPRVGRNDGLLRNQMLYQMRSEPSYLRSEPGGFRLPANLHHFRSEPDQIHPELAQTHPELAQIRNELARIRPDLAQFFSNVAQNQQGSSYSRNYAQNKPGLSQSHPQFLQNGPDLSQFRRELSDLFEKVKIRGLSKRGSEMESEGDAGMWFGPRLGRSDKSIEYDESSEKTNVATIAPIFNSEQNGERVKRKV